MLSTDKAKAKRRSQRSGPLFGKCNASTSVSVAPSKQLTAEPYQGANNCGLDSKTIAGKASTKDVVGHGLLLVDFRPDSRRSGDDDDDDDG